MTLQQTNQPSNQAGGIPANLQQPSPSSPAAGSRPVGGTGASVIFEPVTEIDARMDYGVMCDGITDDYTSMTNAFAGLAARRGRLVLPCTNPSGAPAPIKLSAPIVMAANYGQQIVGQGPQGTTLKMAADNVPIFNLGGSGAGGGIFHSIRLADLKFDYVNSQPSTNTGASPLLFSDMMYESTMERCWFEKGCYAHVVAAGVTGPWGCSWDDLIFNSGLTGGAMDWSQIANSGVPNNHWGRFQVRADNMVGPIFKQLSGGGWIWACVELLNGNQGPQWITMKQGSDVQLGSIGMEISSYGAAAAAMALIDWVGGRLKIGRLVFWTGAVGDQNIVNIPGSYLAVVKNSVDLGGLPGKTDIGLLQLGPTITAGGVSGIHPNSTASYANGLIRIGSQRLQNGATVFDNIRAATMEVVTIDDLINGHITQDLGNADDVIATGSPNIRVYNTPFTAQRTITLPATGMPNGLYYEFVFDGAINGTNTAKIVCNGATLLTQAADKAILRFTYRRSTVSAQAGWVLTKYDTGLPI